MRANHWLLFRQEFKRRVSTLSPHSSRLDHQVVKAPHVHTLKAYLHVSLASQLINRNYFVQSHPLQSLPCQHSPNIPTRSAQTGILSLGPALRRAGDLYCGVSTLFLLCFRSRGGPSSEKSPRSFLLHVRVEIFRIFRFLHLHLGIRDGECGRAEFLALCSIFI
jgi:hypothetical protein